ncbi:ROK family protein [Streptosporangium sp. NPDC023825]|uniref:ROK family protein n=1 Tax=Streptosporangium sp. NPDC023825 TaxID=3154909 RepID=UPI003413B146
MREVDGEREPVRTAADSESPSTSPWSAPSFPSHARDTGEFPSHARDTGEFPSHARDTGEWRPARGVPGGTPAPGVSGPGMRQPPGGGPERRSRAGRPLQAGPIPGPMQGPMPGRREGGAGRLRPQAETRPAPRAFNQLALGSYNEKLVIESIRQAVSTSRVEIAERTGLTPQAVSRITRNLLTSGLLTEDARQSAGAGKPRVPLRLRPDAGSAIGVHLDPKMITVVAVDLCGDLLDQRHLPLPEQADPQWCLAQMTRMALESAEAAHPASEALLGVGVAVPGPLDPRAGLLLDPPLFRDWKHVALKAELATRLDVTVIVEKDSTAAAIGERWLGAADRADDFVYLYLGAGVGSGAFLNGDVYRGRTGNAGEVGQLCAIATGRLTPEGGPDLVPECAPTSAVVDRAGAAGMVVPPGDAAYEWVCEAAARGDRRAVAVIEEVARVIGLGAAGLIDLLDVELLIIGGPAVLPAVADIYHGQIAAAVNGFPMARHLREVEVAQSHLNRAAAAVGAASSVFHEVFTPSLGSRARAAHPDAV